MKFQAELFRLSTLSCRFYRSRKPRRNVGLFCNNTLKKYLFISMWVIYSGVSGYQYDTTMEKQNLNAPYYLIKFICDTTKKTAYCVCNDASVYPRRTQKFLITEKTNPASGNGEVSLDYRGRSWKYFIYESATVPVNETGLNEVGQGRVKVLQVSNTTPEKYTGHQSTFEQY